MFADNSLWEGLSYTCQLSETVKWSGVIKFLTPINLIEPVFQNEFAIYKNIQNNRINETDKRSLLQKAF